MVFANQRFEGMRLHRLPYIVRISVLHLSPVLAFRLSGPCSSKGNSKLGHLQNCDVFILSLVRLNFASHIYGETI